MCVVKTESGAKYGIYTENKWRGNGQYHEGNGKSFIFKIKNNLIEIFKHKRGTFEVKHSDKYIFEMAGGPTGVYGGNQELSWAYLGESFEIPEGQDRGTILCGEMFPRLSEVEIYSLD